MSYDSREQSVSSGQPYELYRFQTEDEEWRLTSADEPKVFQGRVYIPAIVSRTNTTASQEVKGGHIRVTIPQNHPIAQLFISFIPSTPLTLVIYRGHEGEPESEVVVAFTGRVLLGRFTPDDTCELDCAPDTEILRRHVARASFQRPCNRILFDPGCGLVATNWRVLDTVQSVSADGLTVTVPMCASKPNGWFSLGHIMKGDAGRMIVSHSGATLVLMNPMNGLVQGDDVVVYAGCDHTYSTCRNKFNNGTRFMGWEWIPKRNPFSSGLE